MLTLAGGSIYRSLVIDYSWSDAAYVAGLTQSLADALLVPGPRPATAQTVVL